MSASPRGVPAHAVAVDTTASLRSDLSKLLGAAAVQASAAPVARADSRFKLVGVVAAPSPAATAQSVAVIAVDGKPARAFRVGAAVDGDTLLLAVRARSIDLGPRGGPIAGTLELAPLAPAATGSFAPPAGAGGMAIPLPPEAPAAAEASPVQPLLPQPIPSMPNLPAFPGGQFPPGVPPGSVPVGGG